MLETFIEYFEGYFNNQTQAFTRPQEFALIELNHKKSDETTFYVTQKYVYESEPYRDTVIKVFELNDKILVKNYKNDEDLTYLNGCDTLFDWDGTKFHGLNMCNECFVEKGGKNTYLSTEAFLGNNYYNVVDKGFDPETNEQVWGSYHGMFQFDRK